MGVPKFDDFFEPILEFLAKGGVRTRKEIREHCRVVKRLTADDLEMVIPSGLNMFWNRTNWACSYLKMGGLVEPGEKKGDLRITADGLAVLREHSGEINLSFVKKLEAYRKHLSNVSEESGQDDSESEEVEKPANEIIEDAVREINAKTRNDLREAVLEKLKDDDLLLQIIVKALLEKMGYGSRMYNDDMPKKGADGGVDGRVVADEFNFRSVLIQTKNYAEDNGVKTDDVKAFYATLAEHGVTNGVFCTTSYFHKPAMEYVKKCKDRKIALVDGERLWDLMLRYNFFVRDQEKQYVLKEFDGEALDHFVDKYGHV